MIANSASTLLSRRCFLRQATVVSGATSALAATAWPETPENPSTLLAGSGIADITPPLELGILMSSGRQLWEPFDRVRLPLHARAVVVVENASRRIAVVALDLLGIAGEAVGGMSKFKEEVAAAAGNVVLADDLVLSSTHTHSGPESLALSDLHRTEQFKNWVPRLAQGIGTAIRRAADSVRPCSLAIGSRSVPRLSVNRRIETTRGIASVRRELSPDVVIGPEGPIDDGLRMAAFVDRSDRPVAFLVNFTAHPVVEMCIKQISPDFPGEMSLEIERCHPGSAALFLQGASGNINPPKVSIGAEYAQWYGQRLAKMVDKSFDSLHRVTNDEVALCWRTVKLPVRNLAGKLEPNPLETKIGAARVGEAAFVFLPGEPFVEIALAIREASPCRFTAVVGYTEDYIGYIPTDRAFANGGYETRPGRWSRVAVGSEAIVRQEAIDLLKTMWPAKKSERFELRHNKTIPEEM